MKQQTIDDYILFLHKKGFRFKEDVIKFIYFGKIYTSAPDFLVKLALEHTIKVQKQFDGSFYLSLLESFVQHNIKSEKEAYIFLQDKGFVSQ